MTGWWRTVHLKSKSKYSKLCTNLTKKLQTSFEKLISNQSNISLDHLSELADLPQDLDSRPGNQMRTPNSL